MATYDKNTWDDRLLLAAAQYGSDPISMYSAASELGANNLNGADAGLVGKYWSAKGIGRNEEWIRANAPEFWQRQLRDAQNWAADVYQNYGNKRADFINKDIQKKMGDLEKWRTEMQSAAGGMTQDLLNQYKSKVSQLQSQHQSQLSQLRSAAGKAYDFSGVQEQIRASEEGLRQSQEGLRQSAQEKLNWDNFTGQYDLGNRDADKYAGEQSQASGYRQFLEQQLGSAEYNAGNLLSGYDPTAAINAARMTTEGFDAYKNSLSSQSGDYASAQVNALKQRGLFGQNLSQYDQEVRNKLDNLGQVYQAYKGLGDINAQVGSTGKEKVMGLFGLRAPDIQGVQNEFSSMQSSYQQKAKELGMLSGDNAGAQSGEQQMGVWQGIASKFNPAAQGLLSTYGNAQNTLYSMYGDLDAVRTGRIGSEASRQAGLLSNATNTLSGVVGEAGTATTRLENLYNETANRLRSTRVAEGQALTANRLRSTRVAEGQALQEQNAQRSFVDRQNRLMSLAATTLGKPAERTLGTLRRPEEDTQQTFDPLGLSRGYSLLGGF